MIHKWSRNPIRIGALAQNNVEALREATRCFLIFDGKDIIANLFYALAHAPTEWALWQEQVNLLYTTVLSEFQPYGHMYTVMFLFSRFTLAFRRGASASSF